MKTIWTAILLLCAAVLPAQTVQWGPKYARAESYSALEDVVCYHDGRLLTLRDDHDGLNRKATQYPQFLIFNDSLEIQEPVNFDFNIEGHVFSITFVAEIGEQIAVFAIWQKDKESDLMLYKCMIDHKTLRPLGQPELVSDIVSKRYRRIGSFDFVHSPDKSHLLIYSRIGGKGTDAMDRYAMHVYDRNFQTVWSKTVEVPHKYPTFSADQLFVDNAGNAYILGRVDSEDSRPFKPTDQRTLIEAFYDKGNRQEEYEVRLNGKFICGKVSLNVAREKEIICAGFYANEIGYNRMDGGFFTRIDRETKQAVKTTTKEFGIEFITQNMKERKAEKVHELAEKGIDVALESFRMSAIITRQDGGTVVVGEEYNTVEGSPTSSNNQGSAIVHTVYGDLIVVSFSPEGEIDWHTYIPKLHNTSGDDMLTSYVVMDISDSLHFLYNDYYGKTNPSTERQTGYAFSSAIRAVVMHAVVGPNGTVSRRELFMVQEEGGYIIPERCKRVSQNELVMIARLPWHNKICKIRL